MDLVPFPSSQLSLSWVLRSLIGHLGGLFLRGGISQALMMLMHRRIGETVRRMEGLVARFRAGTLRTVARSVGLEIVKSERVKVERIWPVRFGWLVAVGGWKVAAATCSMEAILATSEMQELLVAAPQARRILLPFCRALGVPVHLLRPGTVPVVKVAKLQVKRVRAKRPPVDWGRIPLPRGGFDLGEAGAGFGAGSGEGGSNTKRVVRWWRGALVLFRVVYELALLVVMAVCASLSPPTEYWMKFFGSFVHKRTAIL